MKILFIGGSGIISRAVTQLTLAAGHELWLLNRGQHRPVEGARAFDGATLAAVEQPEFVARGDGELRDGAADDAGAADEENFHGVGR